MGYIYKITNPINQVYIGQTINFDQRYKTYSNLRCKGQSKLYESFLKYGFDKHTIEIIEECNDIDLLRKERFYIQENNSIMIGLNIHLGSEKDNRFGDLSQITPITIDQVIAMLPKEQAAEWIIMLEEALEEIALKQNSKKVL